MCHDRDACTAIAHKIREREPPAGMGNSKELVPVLVRRILGFNRAKYSVKKQELKPV